MAYGIINDINLQNIAAAIRSKANTSDMYKPSQMAQAIMDIDTGGSDELAVSIIEGTIVNLTGGFSYLRSHAFMSMPLLESVDLQSCVYVGGSAFTYCSLLSQVNLPVCEHIDATAFAACSALTSISFPSCKIVGNYAFQRCPSLIAAYLPTCTQIGNYAFTSCSKLASVTIQSCLTIGDYAFSNCQPLQSLDLTACSSIGKSAFLWCSHISLVDLPVCESLSNFAFGSCYRLISMYMSQVTSVPVIGANVFWSTPIGGYSDVAGQYGNVYVPSSLLTDFKNATNWASISSRILAI